MELWGFNVTSFIGLVLSATAIMTFIGLIPIGKKKKLNSTWFWKNLGTYVLVVVCIGGAFVPAIKTETPIMFGFIAAFVAHLTRKAIPGAIRDKFGALIGIKSKKGDGTK